MANLLKDLRSSDLKKEGLAIRGFEEAFKIQRNEKKNFLDNIPYTNNKLFYDIFSNINPKKESKIAVVHTVEWLPLLYAAGYNDVTLLVHEDDKKMEVISKYFGYKYGKISLCDKEDKKRLRKMNIR